MHAFVARQAIFDRALDVYGYELLFRDGPANFFPIVNLDEASSRVIEESLLVFGLDRLVPGKLVFVNVTRRILLEGLFRVLPPERAVIELLETVEPDAETVAACRALKAAGYTLALDDFTYTAAHEPLLDLADIVKLDFRSMGLDERHRLSAELRRRRIRLLAEKLETRQEFEEALRDGFSLMQGHFFCRPKIVTAKSIPGFKLHYLSVLGEIHKPDLDMDALAEMIERDVSLTVKLLRYLNSAAFGWRAPVSTVRQALFVLGERPFRRWASVVLLSGLGSDQPNELAVTSVVRARFASLLGHDLGLDDRNRDLFLAGLLSLLDAFTGLPLADAIGSLGLSAEMREVLLEEGNPGAGVLALVAAYERANWTRVGELAASLDADEASLPHHYLDAVNWADRIFHRAEGTARYES